MTTVDIRGRSWLINGQLTCSGTAAEGQLPNVRMVNAVFEDEARPQINPDEITDRFIAKIPDYKAHGALAFTLSLQGGFPGYENAVNTAFRADGTLKTEYLQRVERVIRACDEHGMIVLLSLYYQRQDQHLNDEEAVRNGVLEACGWVRASSFTNLLLEIANEYGHPGFTNRILREAEGIAELILLAKKECPGLRVSASSLGHGRIDRSVAEASDFITIHFNETPTGKIPARVRASAVYGKPVLCNEDDKTGQAGVSAQRASVMSGCSWGYMHMRWNQAIPFPFEGAADDAEVYREMRRLTKEPVSKELPPATSTISGDTNVEDQAVQWTRWETKLISSYEYDHPFEEVRVDVVFSMPGESDIRTVAFWDGGLEYSMTNAFPKPGSWSYRTICSDQTNWGLHGQTGAVQVLPYNGNNRLFLHGFLQVHNPSRYLTHADGTPFFWMGDTAWNAFFAATEEEWKVYVDDRAAKRFTVIQASLHWNGGKALADRHLNPAQLDKRSWNPAFFKGVDDKIRYANEQGIVIVLTGLPVDEWYGRMLAARYAGSHVIFSPSFDESCHGEAIYDSGGVTGDLHPKYGGTEREVRATAYLSWLSGSLGYTYGAYGLWNWGINEAGVDFREALRLESSDHMKSLALLLESYPWWKLRPASHFIVNNPEARTQRMALSLSEDGSFALAYLPDNACISVLNKAFEGQTKAIFYNPATGDYARVPKVEPDLDGAFKTYHCPGIGDWVLVWEALIP